MLKLAIRPTKIPESSDVSMNSEFLSYFARTLFCGIKLRWLIKNTVGYIYGQVNHLV